MIPKGTRLCYCKYLFGLPQLLPGIPLGDSQKVPAGIIDSCQAIIRGYTALVEIAESIAMLHQPGGFPVEHNGWIVFERFICRVEIVPDPIRADRRCEPPHGGPVRQI